MRQWRRYPKTLTKTDRGTSASYPSAATIGKFGCGPATNGTNRAKPTRCIGAIGYRKRPTPTTCHANEEAPASLTPTGARGRAQLQKRTAARGMGGGDGSLRCACPHPQGKGAWPHALDGWRAVRRGPMCPDCGSPLLRSLLQVPQSLPRSQSGQTVPRHGQGCRAAPHRKPCAILCRC